MRALPSTWIFTTPPPIDHLYYISGDGPDILKT